MRGRVCRLQLLLVVASAVILRYESRETHDHFLLSQIRDSPNLEGQVPVFISPRKRVTRLYPRALGVPRFGVLVVQSLCSDRAENTDSNSSCFVVVQLLLVKNLLHSNSYCLVVCFAIVA
jgi:hypothetical protein